MRKLINIILIIISVIALGIGILIFSFIQSMKPDQAEEEKVRIQAEEYVLKTFKDETVLYDTLFDNMGNFPYFEYAAKVENTQDDTEFLVFYNNESQQMEDSYIADKWANEVEVEIRPFLKEKLGILDDLWVHYDERTGIEFNIDQNNPVNYKRSEAAPTILIFIPRKEEAGDEELFKEIVDYLKTEAELMHGYVSLEYSEKGVPLEEKSFSEEF